MLDRLLERGGAFLENSGYQGHRYIRMVTDTLALDVECAVIFQHVCHIGIAATMWECHDSSVKALFKILTNFAFWCHTLYYLDIDVDKAR